MSQLNYSRILTRLCQFGVGHPHLISTLPVADVGKEMARLTSEYL